MTQTPRRWIVLALAIIGCVGLWPARWALAGGGAEEEQVQKYQREAEQRKQQEEQERRKQEQPQPPPPSQKPPVPPETTKCAKLHADLDSIENKRQDVQRAIDALAKDGDWSPDAVKAKCDKVKEKTKALKESGSDTVAGELQSDTTAIVQGVKGKLDGATPPVVQLRDNALDADHKAGAAEETQAETALKSLFDDRRLPAPGSWKVEDVVSWADDMATKYKAWVDALPPLCTAAQAQITDTLKNPDNAACIDSMTRWSTGLRDAPDKYRSDVDALLKRIPRARSGKTSYAAANPEDYLDGHGTEGTGTYGADSSKLAIKKGDTIWAMAQAVVSMKGKKGLKCNINAVVESMKKQIAHKGGTYYPGDSLDLSKVDTSTCK